MRARLLPLALAATLAFPLAAAAQGEQPNEGRQVARVLVTGQGEAFARPDTALVTLAVMREAETAREALDEANAAMRAVIDAMKEAGIEDRDIQTSGLSIQPRYVHPRNGGDGQPRIVAYQVANTLTVRVRRIDGLGAVIDRSVTLGVNQGGQIVFTNDDPSAARSEARRKAVEDALAKARELAEAAGVGLGPILEISEQIAVRPPVPMGRMMMMEATADASVPIEAGENSYRVEVNVSFELAR